MLFSTFQAHKDWDFIKGDKFNTGFVIYCSKSNSCYSISIFLKGIGRKISKL